jgi:hypothetical protein
MPASAAPAGPTDEAASLQDVHDYQRGRMARGMASAVILHPTFPLPKYCRERYVCRRAHTEPLGFRGPGVRAASGRHVPLLNAYGPHGGDSTPPETPNAACTHATVTTTERIILEWFFKLTPRTYACRLAPRRPGPILSPGTSQQPPRIRAAAPRSRLTVQPCPSALIVEAAAASLVAASLVAAGQRKLHQARGSHPGHTVRTAVIVDGPAGRGQAC